MPMVAQQKPYTLFIVDDDHPASPREDRDNLGKMVCFHNRYNLGDTHDHNEPRDFLHDMLFSRHSSNKNTAYGKPIFDYIKNGHAKEARLEYNRSTREWELLENSHWSTNNDWHTVSSYAANLKGKDVPDWFLDDCLSALRISELKELVEQIEGMVVLPLYLYDHSGITMNTSGFSCSWDSGQVGWIYADTDMVKNEYGDISSEAMKKAESVLEAEVEEYDYYLTGQCYGFKLYEGDKEIESIWGFIGEINDVAKQVQEYLPAECKNIIDSLEHHFSDDEEAFLAQAHEIEDEDEMEM
ncbi:MAG: hypothetical protein FWC16_08795 [Defluviitaleaceae bacterium]|nr:hypothetical protein [Defluviitaleaceae bacterium]MCL2275008.1 hypothetical protein [Defluviitaleaceae bacterium]